MKDRFLIFSDLDASLLNKKSQISKKSIRYIRRLVKKGHIFCVATGRPLQGCLQFVDALNINCPIVTDNGANIYYPDNNMEFDSFAISLKDFKGLLTDIDDIIVCGCAGTYKTTLVQTPELLPYWMIHEREGYSLIKGKILDNINGDTYLPSIVVSDNDKIIEALKKYPSISYRFWGKYENGYNYELFSKDASKGNALLFLKNKYSIEDDKTIAFGDQLNDVSMINAAYYGYAMKNGVEALKKEAKYVTEYDNDHNGVIRVIKNILKTKK